MDVKLFYISNENNNNHYIDALVLFTLMFTTTYISVEIILFSQYSDFSLQFHPQVPCFIQQCVCYGVSVNFMLGHFK